MITLFKFWLVPGLFILKIKKTGSLMKLNVAHVFIGWLGVCWSRISWSRISGSRVCWS
jgi:hypothetical protein